MMPWKFCPQYARKFGKLNSGHRTGKGQFSFQSQRKKVKSLSHIQLFATPWTITYQSSPSMGFSRQEYWNGLPFPSPEDPPDPGIKPVSPALTGRFFTTERPGKPTIWIRGYLIQIKVITSTTWMAEIKPERRLAEKHKYISKMLKSTIKEER